MAMIYVPVPRKEVDHGRRNRDTVVAETTCSCTIEEEDYLRIIHDPKAFQPATLDDCPSDP